MWPEIQQTRGRAATNQGCATLKGAAGRRLLPRGPGPVRFLVVAVVVLATCLWVILGSKARPVDGPLSMPWWLLLPLVTLAQAGQVHFQIRRQTQSVSLGHLPTVFGLVCCSPAGFVLARTLGGLLAMRLIHRQSGIKVLLNSAAYALEAVTAISVLHVLSGWPTAGALYMAMLCADLCSFWVVSLAITLYEGRRDAATWMRPLTWLLPINLVATSVALIALAALWRGLGYLPLLVAVTAALLAAYRAHSRCETGTSTLDGCRTSRLRCPRCTPPTTERCSRSSSGRAY